MEPEALLLLHCGRSVCECLGDSRLGDSVSMYSLQLT